MLKLVSDLISPFDNELFNRSMASDQAPSCFKFANLTPIVEKASLDNADLQLLPIHIKPIGVIRVIEAYDHYLISQ